MSAIKVAWAEPHLPWRTSGTRPCPNSIARHTGEEILLARNGKPRAPLVPLPDDRRIFRVSGKGGTAGSERVATSTRHGVAQFSTSSTAVRGETDARYHAFMWWDENRLPGPVTRLIQEADDVDVSTVTAWEIAIKSALGKIGTGYGRGGSG
jgi:antitoxin (DNA-binding transcriptional repressor) of toxin-antitoxin stability system